MIGIHRGEPGGLTPAAKLADFLIDPAIRIWDRSYAHTPPGAERT